MSTPTFWRASCRVVVIAMLSVGVAAPALAKAAIHGEVKDRNGEPMARVNVRVIPGNVEIVTDDEGKFTIDYLRDEEGNRVRLTRRTTYTFEVYKLGFQLAKADLDYKSGDVTIESVTLTPDTITVRASPTDLDPAIGTQTDAQGGGSYEGE